MASSAAVASSTAAAPSYSVPNRHPQHHALSPPRSLPPLPQSLPQDVLSPISSSGPAGPAIDISAAQPYLSGYVGGGHGDNGNGVLAAADQSHSIVDTTSLVMGLVSDGG